MNADGIEQATARIFAAACSFSTQVLNGVPPAIREFTPVNRPHQSKREFRYPPNSYRKEVISRSQ
jgi:hypothetical protein